MAIQRLSLTRDQFASFLQDFEQIKQFEKLFSTVDTINTVTLDEINVSAGTALAAANEALAQISGLSIQTEFLALAPPDLGGTVTSVGLSGGTTGLTVSGTNPITTSGTFTLGGTLVVANGGTGATNATDARTNLVAAKSGANSDITSLSGITGSISTVDSILFDTAAGVTVGTGRLAWNAADGTLDLGMGYDSVTQQIGLEQYFRIKASAAITDGQCVMFTGSVGASGVLTGAPATGVTNPQFIMGVATMNIAHNGFGYITSFGLVRAINTTGSSVGETWADGDILYYNPAYTGGLTIVPPTAPLPKVVVASVVNAGSGGSGSLFIRVQAEPDLHNLSDVYAPSPISNGQILIGDGPQSRWESATLTAGSGVSITNGAGAITINATGTGGTVTSVSGTGTVNGITLTGTVTTSGSLTLGGTLSGVSLTTQVSGTLPVANGGTGVTTSTGTGSVVLSNTPTLVTPILGAATATSIANGLGAVGTPSYTFTGDLNTGMWSPAADTIAFSEGGVEAMRIDSSGNLLVGATANPGVLNKSVVVNSGASSSAGIVLQNNATGTSSTDGSSIAIAATDLIIANLETAATIFKTSNIERMRLDSSGNVGIGTNAPSYALDVSATGTISGQFKTSGAINALYLADAGTTASTLYVGTVGNDFRVVTGSSERLRITSAGNVGIGNTPSGTYKLEVTGALNASSMVLGAALPVASGGTGQTTYTNGQLLIGNTTGNTLTKATLTPGTNVSITNGAGAITINATDQFTGTVTSVSGTGTVSGITLTGTVTTTGSLTLGGTLAVTASNFASQTANTFLAAPNGLAGVPTFRAVVAADIPTLNQNTTGTASNVTGTVAIANGGTGAITAPLARTALGATTVGSNVFTLTNPSAITFPRFNADNSVSALDAATFRTAIGAGTGSGTVTSVGGTGTVNGITLTGTVTSSGNLTLGGTLSGVSLTTQVSGTLPVANGGTGVTSSTGTVAVVLSNTPTLVTPILGVASATSIATGLGLVGTPAYTFTGDLNTGMWSPAADTVAVSTVGVERIRIDSSGNVGIGTNAPGVPLDVNGTARIRSNFFVYGAGDRLNVFPGAAASGVTVISTNNANTAYAPLVLDGNRAVFNVDGVERMRVDSGGNVGIGTNAPGYKLDVSATGTISSQFKTSGSINAMYLADVGTTAGTLYIGTVGNDFRVVTGSNERMRIDNGGNVGIGGTANASALLDVQSTTKGFRLPNMTTVQKNAIATPAAGLMIFDTTLAKACVYSGAAWQTITSV